MQKIDEKQINAEDKKILRCSTRRHPIGRALKKYAYSAKILLHAFKIYSPN